MNQKKFAVMIFPLFLIFIISLGTASAIPYSQYLTASNHHENICGTHICTPTENFNHDLKNNKNIIIPIISINKILTSENTSQNNVHLKNICILEPTDFFMDKNYLVPLITKFVQRHNVTTTQINIVDEINKKTQGCDVMIHIERAINSNLPWVYKNTRYLVQGNTITIFTYKTTKVGGFSDATARNTVMTSCFGLGERFPHIYGTQNDYSSPISCDPYQGYRHNNNSNILPPNIIKKSVDSALKQLGF